jgi:DNA-binding ferritin-like protein (Dps family)
MKRWWKKLVEGYLRMEKLEKEYKKDIKKIKKQMYLDYFYVFLFIFCFCFTLYLIINYV